MLCKALLKVNRADEEGGRIAGSDYGEDDTGVRFVFENTSTTCFEVPEPGSGEKLRLMWLNRTEHVDASVTDEVPADGGVAMQATGGGGGGGSESSTRGKMPDLDHLPLPSKL